MGAAFVCGNALTQLCIVPTCPNWLSTNHLPSKLIIGEEAASAEPLRFSQSHFSGLVPLLLSVAATMLPSIAPLLPVRRCRQRIPPSFWIGTRLSARRSSRVCVATAAQTGGAGECHFKHPWELHKACRPCVHCHLPFSAATELESKAQLLHQLCPPCSSATLGKAVQGPGGRNGSEFKAALAKCSKCVKAHTWQLLFPGQDNATPTELMPYWKGAGFSSLGDCLARGPIGNCRDTWRGYKWVPCGGSYCREGAATATELESPAQLTWQLCPSCSPATMAKAVQGPGGPNGSEFKAALAKCTQCQQAHMKQIMAAGNPPTTSLKMPWSSPECKHVFFQEFARANTKWTMSHFTDKKAKAELEKSRKWLAAHCGKAAATELLGRKWWTTAWEKSQHKGAATATELENSWNPVWEKALHKEGMPPTELMPYWKGAGFSSLGDCLARGPIGNCRDTWRGYKWVPCGGSYCREG